MHQRSILSVVLFLVLLECIGLVASRNYNSGLISYNSKTFRNDQQPADAVTRGRNLASEKGADKGNVWSVIGAQISATKEQFNNAVNGTISGLTANLQALGEKLSKHLPKVGCDKTICIVCAELEVAHIKHMCMNMEFDPEEMAVRMDVFINDVPTFKNNQSLLDPTPVTCDPIPNFPVLNICIEMLNIAIEATDMRMNLDISLRQTTGNKTGIHFPRIPLQFGFQNVNKDANTVKLASNAESEIKEDHNDYEVNENNFRYVANEHPDEEAAARQENTEANTVANQETRTEAEAEAKKLTLKKTETNIDIVD